MARTIGDHLPKPEGGAQLVLVVGAAVAVYLLWSANRELAEHRQQLAWQNQLLEHQVRMSTATAQALTPAEGEDDEETTADPEAAVRRVEKQVEENEGGEPDYEPAEGQPKPPDPGN